jgi:hypothetical protein
MLERARKTLSKKVKKGFCGYPVATVAFYGPNDTIATKLTVGIACVIASHRQNGAGPGGRSSGDLPLRPHLR